MLEKYSSSYPSMHREDSIAKIELFVKAKNVQYLKTQFKAWCEELK